MPECSPTSAPRARRRSATVSIEAVRKALRDAAAGKAYDLSDLGGVELRVRGGRVIWTVRVRMLNPVWVGHATKVAGDATPVPQYVQRRFELGEVKIAPPAPSAPARSGAISIDPECARERARALKNEIKGGRSPHRLLTEWSTGVSVRQQIAEEQLQGPPSITWEEAVDWFLDEYGQSLAVGTLTTYRKVLKNEPEWNVFKGRFVSTITAGDVANALAKIAARSESAADGAGRTVRALFTRLAEPGVAERSGVAPGQIRNAKPPKGKLNDAYVDGSLVGDDDDEGRLPTTLEIGRAIAIAKAGVLGLRNSAAVLLQAATAQRNRAVAGINRRFFETIEDEICWKVPPFFRKTAKKKRSASPHLVPLVGWAVEAQQTLDRLAPKGERAAWLLPAKRAKGDNRPTQTPHWHPRTVSAQLEKLPGVGFLGHSWRNALATYGPKELGWTDDDAKLILDHLEGHEPNDVTAQFYNSNPAILRKRKMMAEWQAFLDRCEAEAIAADPVLRDPVRLGELVYVHENGEKRHAHILDLARRKGRPLPWSKVERLIRNGAVIESLVEWRKKRVPA